MEKNIIYETIAVSIAIGQSQDAQARDLRNGICIGVKFIDFSSNTNRPHAIDISVNRTDGSALTGKTDFRDYSNAGGGAYLETFKTTYFDTNSQITTQVQSAQAIADADFVGQLIFAIEVPCL